MNKIIQIVEDDEDIRSVLEYILVDANFIVESFADVKSFRNRQRRKVDLFLLDVMLPDGNGIELSESLKSDERTSKIPIIIMSAHASGKQAFSESKIEGFIAKPFDLDLVINRVNSIFN